MPSQFEQAQSFVGNVGEDYFAVGQLQLELLQWNGCTPGSHVLEIGAGCLVAGRPLIQFLEPDRYVGIEPNTWLVDAALHELAEAAALVEQKRPVFLPVTDFDASPTGRIFDFVISHSVLSHAAAWQCPLFMAAVARVLAPAGVALASIRFYDDHNVLVGDSSDTEWVYPGVSFFSWETVRSAALATGLLPEWRPDYKEFFVKRVPSNYHDWIRLTRLPARP